MSAFLPILALGFLLGGTTAGIICAFLYAHAIEKLTAEHTRQRAQDAARHYHQGYEARALLGLQPPTQAPPDHWPAITQARKTARQQHFN